MRVFLFYLSVLCIAKVSSDILFAGVNSDGFEISGDVPGRIYFQFTPPVKTSLLAFKNAGMNTIRLPFKWERAQQTLGGPLNYTYIGYLQDTVDYTTGTLGMYIILDPHNFGRYNGQPIGGAQGPTYEQFGNFWSQFATVFKNNSKVLFGLMNEPNNMPNEDVFGGMQAAVNAIRSTGATQFILVPGNGYTGAHNWMSGGGGLFMINITDPLNRFIFEMHQYFDTYSSGAALADASYNVTQNLGPTTNWLRPNNRTALIGEFGIELNRTICVTILNQVLSYFKENSDVWVGWTWWSAGPWWGNYFYTLEPYSNGTFPPQMAVLKDYFPSKYDDPYVAWGTSGRSHPASTTSKVSSSGSTTAGASKSTTAGASSKSTTAGAASKSTTGGASSSKSTAGSTSSRSTGATGSTTGVPSTMSTGTSSPASSARSLCACISLVILALAL